MANKGFQKQHRYRLIDQKIALLQSYPEAACSIHHGILTWEGIDRKNKTVKICLHLGHEFNASQLIAECIVPWAVEWLYFYELWLATGEWCGGGKHPGRPVE